MASELRQARGVGPSATGVDLSNSRPTEMETRRASMRAGGPMLKGSAGNGQADLDAVTSRSLA